jgi:hypothetical protein
MFGSNGDEVTPKLHNEELHNLYSSRNIKMIKFLNFLRWVGHEAHMPLYCKTSREKNDFGDLEMDGWMDDGLLSSIVQEGRVRIRDGHCRTERRLREPSDSVKYWTSGCNRADVTPCSSVEVHQTTRRLI